MKKVVMLLTNPFRPDPRVYKEAKTLIEDGYDVTVIAWDREGGYPREEIVENIKVHRISIKSTYGDFFSFITKLPLFWVKAFLYLLKTNFDIVHCHDLDTLPLGSKAAKIKNKKLIYDSHENYPGLIENACPKILLKFVEKIESILIKQVDRTITVNRVIAGILRKRGAVNVSVVMNCGELKRYERSEKEREAFRKTMGWNGKTIVLYIGTLEPYNYLEGLVGIFKEIDEDISFVIGGDGSLKERVLAGMKDTQNIKYLGWVPLHEVPKYTCAADILIASSDPTNKSTKWATSIKLFEAMAAGKPIIVSKDTLTGDIAAQEDCGLQVTYGGDNEIKEAIYTLKNDATLRRKLGKNGLRAAREKYNWEVCKKEVLNLYSVL